MLLVRTLRVSSSLLRLAACCLLLAIPYQQTHAQSPGAADGSREPLALLKLRCGKCHGSLKPEQGLSLMSLEGIAQGGKSGPVVLPGKPDESLLWQRIADDEMPPDQSLPKREADVLRRWIEVGAPGLRPAGERAGSVNQNHWAFRPVQAPPLPPVRDERRIVTSVDRFIQARLEGAGLSLGDEAPRAQLIRRVTRDLHGLPPSPEEVAAFVADESPDAYERLVDRLLASPDYGVRWGKYWLDSAGYADSNGYFHADTLRPLAYRYRDYVIDALNRDKPFDQFVVEQLAGDELARFEPGTPVTPETFELLVATHFLRNGQDGTDISVDDNPEAMRVDRYAALEAAMQVTSSALLGLTFHCARCHDHKFEPLTQEDYYRFQAIFYPAFNPVSWVKPQDRHVFAPFPEQIGPWREALSRHEAEVAKLRGAFLATVQSCREKGRVLLREDFGDAPRISSGWELRRVGAAPATAEDRTALAGIVDRSALRLNQLPENVWLSHRDLRLKIPQAAGSRLEVTLDIQPDEAEYVEAAPRAFQLGFGPSMDAPVGKPGEPPPPVRVELSAQNRPSLVVEGRDAGRTAHRLGNAPWKPNRRYGLRLTRLSDAKVQVEALVDWVADEKPVELPASLFEDVRLFIAGGPNAGFRLTELLVEVHESPIPENEPLLSVATNEVAFALRQFRKQYEERREKLDQKRPERPGKIAWLTDVSSKPPEVHLLRRGGYGQHDHAVEAGPPAVLCVAGDSAHFEAVPSERTTGRRLAFARWLTGAGSRPAALLARVFVNRMWQQHFRDGLAPTSDNLGLSGALPTHPELLEHLTAEFTAGGWSRKRLHRLIVLSRTYRQSSRPHADGFARDPANDLLWRYPLRRLDAEAIRDSMLAAAGDLDATLRGPPIPIDRSPTGEVVASSSGARRRSVFLTQRRSQTVSMLRVFDAPAMAVVCTDRPSSAIPLQSLTLLNSEFCVERARRMAARARSEAGSEPLRQIERAFRIALGRAPTNAETTESAEFVEQQSAEFKDQPDPRQEALAALCQCLLAGNEFLTLE